MGINTEEYFDVVRFLEFHLHETFPDFHIEIVSVEDLPNQYALTYPESKCIQIREDVYNGAIEGNSRDRFTLAHEIGHLWLHSPSKIALARNSSSITIPAYMDPEWQANTFAGELLVPPMGTIGLTVDEVVERFGVSSQVAKIQMDHY